MPNPTFSDVVRVAATMPDSKGRRDLTRILRSAKLEWDEDLRKRLRKQNKDGFVIAGLMGKSVSVHLNKGKPPFFNIKPPKRRGDYGPFGSTIGNVWATLQTDVHLRRPSVLERPQQSGACGLLPPRDAEVPAPPADRVGR